MNQLIKRLLKEGLHKPMYFLRWTSSPEDDIRRNFSGHMQAWYNTKEEAYTDYNEAKADGRYLESEPKEDPVSGMWNADPEWGLSGYGFNDEESFITGIREITDIAWHHEDYNSQKLYIFKSLNYQLGNGFDGEDVFKDTIKYWPINKNITFKDVLKLIE